MMRDGFLAPTKNLAEVDPAGDEVRAAQDGQQRQQVLDVFLPVIL